MERRDLFEDDLTEERMSSPAQRDVVAGTQTLDPDASKDEGRAPWPHATADPDEDDEDDEDEDDDEEELDD